MYDFKEDAQVGKEEKIEWPGLVPILLNLIFQLSLTALIAESYFHFSNE